MHTHTHRGALYEACVLACVQSPICNFGGREGEGQVVNRHRCGRACEEQGASFGFAVLSSGLSGARCWFRCFEGFLSFRFAVVGVIEVLVCTRFRGLGLIKSMC